MRHLILLPAAALLLTACSDGYDEDAHRAALAEAADVEELPQEQWEELQALGEESCDMDEQGMALATAIAADGDDPERHIAVRRVNVKHLCPERLEEFDEVESTLVY